MMPIPAKPIPDLSDGYTNKFWSKVNQKSQYECWDWLGACEKNGRGVVRIQKGLFKAARIAYFLTHGLYPGEQLVCHTCDNPNCVNPEHLFLGSHVDNMTDMARKGRGNGPHEVGESSNGHTLTDNLVRKIRAASGTQRDIAIRYKISQSSVSRVRSRKFWGHVQ